MIARPLLLVLALALLATPAAAQGLSLIPPTASAEPVQADPLIQQLAQEERELQQRLEVLRAQARWALERAEARRADLEVEERTLTQKRRRSLAERETAREAMTVLQELQQATNRSAELWDGAVDALLDALAEVRALRGRLDWQASLHPEESRGHLEQLAAADEAELATLAHGRDSLRTERGELVQLVDSTRQRLVELRKTLVRQQVEAMTPLEGVEGDPRPEGADPDLLAALTRLQIRLAERELEQARTQVDRAELASDLLELREPVLRRRLEGLRARAASLASFEQGGLFARSPWPVEEEQLRQIARRARELVRSEAHALELVARPLRPESPPSRGRWLMLAAASLLLFLLLPRLRRRLSRVEASTSAGRILIGSTTAASLGLLPVGLAGAAVALELLASDAGWVLVAACALPGACALWLSGARLMVVEATALGVDPTQLRRASASARVLALAVVALTPALVLSPLLGFPALVPWLVYVALTAVALLTWLVVAARPRPLLEATERILDLRVPPALHDTLLSFHHVAAFTPIALFCIYLAGWQTFARFAARGGLVTVFVLMLTPVVWRAGRSTVGALSGHPGGGGLLNLSERRAAALYRGLLPPVLLLTAGLAAAAIGAAWGHGHPLDTAVHLLSRPLLEVGGSSISLVRLGLFALVMSATWLVSRWTLRFLRDSIYPLYDLDAGSMATMDTVSRYALLGAGSLIGLDVAGVGTGILTVFAGVVGIGIGFGSQTLASNFISGLILLLARPVAVGDTIEVGGLVGRVARISSYATVLQTLDNLTVLLPNSRIVDDSVINWSIDDRRFRLPVSVGVAYGSDTALVARLLLESVRGVDGLLARPEPEVRFDDFGESALLFSVLPWTKKADERRKLASQLRFSIDRLFREHGVEIAFPQIDVHLRSSDEVLRIADERGSEVLHGAGPPD